MENKASEKLSVYLFRLPPVMVIVVFGLQMIRLLLSSLVVYLREIVGVNSLILGPIGLGIFILSLFILLLYRLAGARKALWIVTGGLCIFRITEQVSSFPAVDIWIAAAGAVCFILYIPLGIGISWNRGDKIFWGTAFFLGIVLDRIILVITSTVDLSWYTGFWPVLAVVLFSLVLIFGQYKSLVGEQSVDAAQGMWHSSFAPAGIGPFLALQLLVFQNIPRLSASMHINSPVAGFVIILVNGIALTCALLYDRIKLNWIIKPVIPGLLLLALLCIPMPMGFLYLVCLVTGQIASLLLFIPLLAGPDRLFPGKLHRLGVANFIGQLLFVILIFIYYIPYDIDLGFRSWVILPAAALFFLVFVFLKSKDHVDEQGHPEGILKPALAALLPVCIPLFLLFTTGDPKPAIPAPGNKTVHILTYNLYNGYNVDGFFAGEEHARLIEKSGADIVALQEIIRGMLDWNGADTLEWLSRRLGMSYAYGFTTDVMAGNAILSRYPIIASENNILPPDSLPTLRGCLKAKIDIGGTQLTVMTTHFYHLKSHPEYRTQQAARILEVWNKEPNTVLTGDFNSEPGTEPINLLADASLVNVSAEMSGSPVLTYPSRKPERQIDYIWTSPDLRLSDFILYKEISSDHLAMSVRITTP